MVPLMYIFDNAYRSQNNILIYSAQYKECQQFMYYKASQQTSKQQTFKLVENILIFSQSSFEEKIVDFLFRQLHDRQMLSAYPLFRGFWRSSSLFRDLCIYTLFPIYYYTMQIQYRKKGCLLCLFNASDHHLSNIPSVRNTEKKIRTTFEMHNVLCKMKLYFTSCQSMFNSH